jgi:BolA protein
MTEAFAPESVRVIDESHQHEGHAGHRPGGESHFRLYIVSKAFRGKSHLERHRYDQCRARRRAARARTHLQSHAALLAKGLPDPDPHKDRRPPMIISVLPNIEL